MTHLDLTSDQELFRKTTARFIESQCSMETVRELTDHSTGVDPKYLAQAAELGWFASFIPSEFGGGSVSGSPVLDACIVAEERGRALQPGPFVAHNVVAWAVAAVGTTEQRSSILPALADADEIATWAVATPAGSCAPGSVRATEVPGGFALNGTVGLAEDAHLATWILVSAQQGEGLQTDASCGEVIQFLIPSATAGIIVRPLSSLDITRRMSAIQFHDVKVPQSQMLGAPTQGHKILQAQIDLASVLLVAESIGAIDRLFQMTCQYASDRIAFGRPIGSFQALKHLLADLSLFAEAGRAGSVAAAQSLDTGRSFASEVTSIAKAFVSEHGIEIAQGCFQVHGGIGFTWEHDLHLFLRRLTSNSILYGDADWHRERICGLHGI